MRMPVANMIRNEIAAVVIGRNEGGRLIKSLNSIRSQVDCVVYVDSGSTDGSAQAAIELGAHVVNLDRAPAFSAARARNQGFAAVKALRPEILLIQFIDGDCELVDGWLETAVKFMNQRNDVGAVCGRRRERFPELSVYNWLCDREWDGPVGEVRAFGGDVIIRATVLEVLGGYRDDVIAAEDDELSVRLRAAGWRIWRLRSEMTLHDAAIKHFRQWWLRSVRCGYAYAQGANLHGTLPERHFVWESRRARLWGLWLPIACLVLSLILFPWGFIAWLIYPTQVFRQMLRNTGSLGQRLTLAFFQLLARFPEAFGQIKFARNRLLSRRAWLIEYK
jgi:glycosyltransferase involved in cell wall biosynthesis